MAKDVKFEIKLSIDGKEQIVTASTNVEKLAKELGCDLLSDYVTLLR